MRQALPYVFSLFTWQIGGIMHNFYLEPKHLPHAGINLRIIFVSAFTLSLVGCATIPDLSGYTAATDQLRQSVKSAGESVTTEIELVSLVFKESGGDATTISQLTDAKDKFQKQWEERNKAMTAIVGYASSLEAIASAGKDGKESAKALGDSIEGLLSTLGIVPGAQLANVANETIQIIYAEVAKVKAQESLEKSLQATGPIMEQMVAIIEVDSAALKASFEIAIDAQILQLQRNNEPVRSGNERDALIKLRDKGNKELVNELKKTDQNNHANKIKELGENISVIDKRLSALNPEWVSYTNDLKELHSRKRIGLALMQASSKALTAWKGTHVKLSDAVKNKRSPSIHEVIAAANDIQQLVKKWGEL
jgi:hypothetical protein